MSPAMARTFIVGFGLEVGSIYSLCLQPGTEYIAQPLALIGAGMMFFAVVISHK